MSIYLLTYLANKMVFAGSYAVRTFNKRTERLLSASIINHLHVRHALRDDVMTTNSSQCVTQQMTSVSVVFLLIEPVL